MKKYRDKLVLYFIFTLLSTFFGVFSIAMLMTFFDLIFKAKAASNEIRTGKKMLAPVNDYLVHIILSSPDSKVVALSLICGFPIVATLLKNLFLYFSNLLSAPIRSSVVT